MGAFRKIVVALPVALMALGANPAAATFYDGNRLAAVCFETEDFYPQGSCMGFIIGVHDAFARDLCVPDGVQAGQIRGVVLNFLRENPEGLHLSAWSLVKGAIEEAFPCQ